MSPFKPVDFSKQKEELLNNPGASPKKKEMVFKPKKLEKAVEQIELEFNKAFIGDSEYVPRAIQRGTAQITLEVFNRLKKVPTKKTLEDFLEVCNQDFGNGMKEKVEELLKDAWEEK